ncbi:asparagine synthase-related protein [Capillibacterium thermochitinicola]|uniref:asparagine synthase (glutamine-hydrolyzing) n=1 Tax=Capillibacterium thermochitinicola TaxID=2699427 RepID=A0A8J6LIM7_9FIRM|nr:asparagine synthase-related protein [Capillibacterium thermochitinicola]MBA2132811.1 asparagine synthase [Capillibacterium thermochitinicola]
MAGIVGVCRTGECELVEKMLAKIRHRGPGGQKVIAKNGGVLGVVYRKGTKPPFLDRPRCSAVWDGRFSRNLNRVETDTPLALAALKDGKVLLVRDGLGISPLYYGEVDGILVFASEVKALVGIVQKVREFPPGHKYVSGEGFQRFFGLKPVETWPLPKEEAARRLRKALEQAVADYIKGQTEVGSLLSGGLDSSTLSALARRRVDRLHTFACGLEGASDLEYAREVAKHIGSIHHEAVYTIEDIWRVLPDVIYHLESFDALLIRSAVTHYLVTKMVSDYVPAAFSGEGGDELFAGYDYYKELPPELLNGELIESIKRLHNTALQRVDRSAAAYGTDAYVGFLAPPVVKLAVRIPVEYKLYQGAGEEPVEKWILRKAVEDLLPDDVLWRPKVKFWKGTGIGDRIAARVETQISDVDFRRERRLPDGSYLNTKEELFYYRIFKEHFGTLTDLSFVGRTKGAPCAPAS